MNKDYKFLIQIRKKMKLSIISFTLLLLTAPFAFAQDGALDVTFNSTGTVTTSIGSSYDGVKSIAIQSDGKIVVTGVYPHGTDDDFAVARYNTDGSLDNTFSGDGLLTTSIGSFRDAAYSIAIQSDGKIIVVGATSNGTNNDIGIARYTTSGDLDITFDSDGIVTTVVGSSDNPAYGVAIQTDGKIVVCGYAHIGLYDDFMVVRYNSDGSLDTGFGVSGVTTTNFGAGVAAGKSIALQSDGKIIVAGYFSTGGTAVDFAVARYDSDGLIDATFSGDGKVTTAIGSATDVGQSVAIQADGKIVVAGYSKIGSTDDFSVVRYNADGSLDTGFDIDGKVTTDFGLGTDWGYSVALQLDGKIVVAGFGYVSSTKIAVARYNSDGTLDTGLDSDGKVTTAISSNSAYGSSVALQSDGKIVVAGQSYVSGSESDFAVVRYSGSSGPLPVELTLFSAVKFLNSIKLEWQTATEINNYGFEIERSEVSGQRTAVSGQLSDWEKIGFVNGHGNSNSPKEYSFIDHSVLSGSYSYRLKQLDTDGKFEYSDVVTVEIENLPVEFTLHQNYPNPFNPSTKIKFTIPEGVETRRGVSLRIIDILGNEIATLVNEEKEPGVYEVEFYAKNFPAGIYFCRFEVNSTDGKTKFSDTQKMILLK